ncbi:MAG: GntG family PLP-dependent aldolase [Bryobacteraceae bacterium]
MKTATIPIRIDLYSDTLTKPSPAMRKAIAEAEVGDEQRFEDPSVNLLQDMTAEILRKEAALFLPSGTMGTLISTAIHCRSGDEILCDQTAHILNAEGAGAAAVAGAIIRGLPGDRGIYTVEQLRAAIRPRTRYHPRTRMVSVEQTSNQGGGAVWPLDAMRDITREAGEHGLARHLDGARLFNASVASGVAPHEYAEGFESVWIDLSKGLGAPAGAVLAGSRDFIDAAWQWKQRLGGALRQAGILAAAGVYALRNNIARLAEDHRRAKVLAAGLAEIPRIGVASDRVETNIVMIDVSATGKTSAEVLNMTLAEGLRFSVSGPTRLRAVTHMDISDDDIQETLRIVRDVV